MVPPVGTTEVRLEVVSRSTGDDDRRSHQSPDYEKDTKDADDHSQSLEQIKIGDPDWFRGANVENHRYPGTIQFC